MNCTVAIGVSFQASLVGARMLVSAVAVECDGYSNLFCRIYLATAHYLA